MLSISIIVAIVSSAQALRTHIKHHRALIVFRDRAMAHLDIACAVAEVTNLDRLRITYVVMALSCLFVVVFGKTATCLWGVP